MGSDETKYEKAKRLSAGKFDHVLVALISGVFFWTYLILTDSPGPMNSKIVLDIFGNYRVVEAPKDPDPKLEELVQIEQALESDVRDIRAVVKYFEIDEKAKRTAKQLQEITRELLHYRYGKDTKPYRVLVQCYFQDSFPNVKRDGHYGNFTIEMAPSSIMPHSIHMFFELVEDFNRAAREDNTYGGFFNRFEDHLMQIRVKYHRIDNMAFQEYSEEWPHTERTVGFTGRPSGPHFVINLKNNTDEHGPGSDYSRSPYEADPCFGKIVDGWDVVERIHIPVRGFVNDQKNQILVNLMTILVPTETGEYKVWERKPYDKRPGLNSF